MELSEALPEKSESSSTTGVQAIETQAQQLHALALSLNGAFESAVQVLLENSGYLVISGMGKSGWVGRKMAAAFSAIGSPSFFIHPHQAVHGDSTVIPPGSVVLLISDNGDDPEILSLTASLQHTKNKLIAIVANEDSSLARSADIVLALPIQRETGAYRLVPSTTAVLAMALGDALVTALLRQKREYVRPVRENQTEDNKDTPIFPLVRDYMHKRIDKNLPIVSPTTPAQEIIWAMIQGRLEMVLVMAGELLAGIITDNNLHTAMRNTQFSMTETTAADIMHWNPATISENAALSEAEKIMIRKKVKALVALDDESRVSGVVEII